MIPILPHRLEAAGARDLGTDPATGKPIIARLGRFGPMVQLGEATDELAIRYVGDQLDIGFNASYLLEVLRYMPAEDVKITFKAPERAATLEPEGGAWRLDGRGGRGSGRQAGGRRG